MFYTDTQIHRNKNKVTIDTVSAHLQRAQKVADKWYLGWGNRWSISNLISVFLIVTVIPPNVHLGRQTSNERITPLLAMISQVSTAASSSFQKLRDTEISAVHAPEGDFGPETERSLGPGLVLSARDYAEVHPRGYPKVHV